MALADKPLFLNDLLALNKVTVRCGVTQNVTQHLPLIAVMYRPLGRRAI
jgi:hypothetical protein